MEWYDFRHEGEQDLSWHWSQMNERGGVSSSIAHCGWGRDGAFLLTLLVSSIQHGWGSSLLIQYIRSGFCFSGAYRKNHNLENMTEIECFQSKLPQGFRMNATSENRNHYIFVFYSWLNLIQTLFVFVLWMDFFRSKCQKLFDTNIEIDIQPWSIAKHRQTNNK